MYTVYIYIYILNYINMYTVYYIYIIYTQNITWLLGPVLLATATNLLLCLWHHHEHGHITSPSFYCTFPPAHVRDTPPNDGSFMGF